MLTLLVVASLVAPALFLPNLDRAFALAKDGEWAGAAAALDAAYAEDPALFTANNLHYLRGRVAESQEDWVRARTEFEIIGPVNSLRPLAAWRAARASIRLGDIARAEELMNELPATFPPDLKLQTARESPPSLALKIYAGVHSRQARLGQARILGDTAMLWRLLRDRNIDDVALEAARLLAPLASTPQELLDVADAFLSHRQFENALDLYRRAGEAPEFSPRSMFQIARVHFLRQDYARAADQYRSVAGAYAGTEWEQEAAYQLAACYWRLGEYRQAEKAYLDYIARYGRGADEGAVRNLVDVYRALGEYAKAISLLDRTLRGRLSTSTRQVLLFSKAKILYAQKRYQAALGIFRQLGRTRLQSAPGGASREEVRYFEAMTLSNLGQRTAARKIWKELAADSFSYYGQKAAERLGLPQQTSAPSCDAAADAALDGAMARLHAARRPLRSELDSTADPVSELVFMQLWDEAFMWLDLAREPSPRIAADLAYVAGRYNRAIAHADRLPKNQADRLFFLYPAGYSQTICRASSQYQIDAGWLHAIIWQESKYNPAAQSAASARGLMQFIPETAMALAPSAGMSNLTLERLYDPETSIRLGAHYWAELMEEFRHPELALAAYNGGPDNVRRWRDKWPGADLEFFVSDIGFIETKRYVQAVFGARAGYRRAQ